MCGIVGYTGNRDALPLLLDSLRRVTYRGYDSYGVAVLNGTGIELHKSVGAVDQEGSSLHLEGSVGIGHTRWATVGGVTTANAHPHLDCTGQLAIVHNGDIDNFQSLRSELLEHGHVIKSETDSELIAHVLEEEYQQSDLCAALERTSKRLEGSYAIAAIEYQSRDMAVIRQSSPVVIGIGAGEAFVASDAPAIISYTNEVIYPEDGEVVLLRPDGVKVFRGGIEVGRAVTRLDWDESAVERGGHEHFMIKEINEQPAAIRDTLVGYLQDAVRLPVENPSQVLIVACGSSYHAALMAGSLIEEVSPIPTRVCIASEFVQAGQLPENTLVLAISQSGETADTLNAVRALKAAGHKILGITNVRQSSIARLSDVVMYTEAGPEVAVAATKTLTTQLTVLTLIVAALAQSGAARRQTISSIRQLPNIVQEVLANQSAIEEAGQWLSKFERLFVVAKGANFPVALESALKLKEVAYIHAEGVPAGELKHGAFALLSRDMPVLAFIDDDRTLKRMITAVREIKARGGPVVIVGNSNYRDVAETADLLITTPPAGSGLNPIINTVVGQLLSYHAGVARGCPIDRPRNLAKSVTVP